MTVKFDDLNPLRSRDTKEMRHPNFRETGPRDRPGLDGEVEALQEDDKYLDTVA